MQLAPKSKVHIRSLLSALFEYASWADLIPLVRNPMELVSVKNASRRGNKARVLTVKEFHLLLGYLTEPYRTMALVLACLGLRISELLGLQWGDINWLERQLKLKRAVVKQMIDEVKSIHSAKPLPLDALLVDVLRAHKQRSEFVEPGDWVFASPEQLGKLPRSYTCVYEKLSKAAKKAGLGHISSHSFRHSYRSWLDELGTPISVQQRAMRHGDIRVTMNVYGELVGDELRKANSKVVDRLIGLRMDCGTA
jgi:integrase